MKLIKLEVLVKDVDQTEENGSYQSVLEELNLSTETESTDETYWKSMYFNLKVLNDELLSLEPRVGYEKSNTALYFYDGRSIIINTLMDDLAKNLSDDTKRI